MAAVVCVNKSVKHGSIILKTAQRVLKFNAFRLSHYQADKMQNLSSKDIRSFAEDGVICLRGVFNKSWVEKVKRGIEKNVANPSEFSERLLDKDGSASSYFNDFLNWKRIPEFNEFVWKSPASQIAMQLMADSKKVAFYHDHVFTKDPGNSSITPWHHDQAYYPINGFKNCSIWMPVTPVSKSACLRYVKGSHKWGKWFVPKKFETNKNYMDEWKDETFSEMVDVDSGEYELLAWDLEPGDCIAFYMRTVHGSSETTPDENGRQVLATRWLGDDAVIASRPWTTSPPITADEHQTITHGQSLFDFPESFPMIIQ